MRVVVLQSAIDVGLVGARRDCAHYPQIVHLGPSRTELTVIWAADSPYLPRCDVPCRHPIWRVIASGQEVLGDSRLAAVSGNHEELFVVSSSIPLYSISGNKLVTTSTSPLRLPVPPL